MQREKIDIESWERKETYNFFKTFVNPTLSITVELECGKAFKYAKANQKSFFLVYSYALLKGCNEIEEFRYRAEQTPQEQEPSIYRYKRIDLSTPIKVNEKGKYIQKVFEYNPDFETFHNQTRKEIESIDEQSEVFCEDTTQGGIVSLSATPSLAFTSIAYTLRYEKAINFLPLITVGKMQEREGKRIIPIAISIHHGLIDGHHVTQFFDKVQEALNSF